MLTYAQQQKSAELTRMADEILRRGRIVQTPPTPDGKFRITTAWIKQNATPAGGFKAAQVKLLGERYPLASGWMDRASGRLISQEARRQFEAFHGGYKATGKSKQVMSRQAAANPVSGEVYATTGPSSVSHCGCSVHAWEDCEHTLEADDREAERAMREMLA
jgi:hypothetical protein